MYVYKTKCYFPRWRSTWTVTERYSNSEFLFVNTGHIHPSQQEWDGRPDWLTTRKHRKKKFIKQNIKIIFHLHLAAFAHSGVSILKTQKKMKMKEHSRFYLWTYSAWSLAPPRSSGVTSSPVAALTSGGPPRNMVPIRCTITASSAIVGM